MSLGDRPRAFPQLRAFPTMLRIGFVDAVAYRAEFLIWILSTNMPLVMLALWHAVAREHPVGPFTQERFVAWFLCALIVRMLTGSWVAWTLNYDLRHGMLAFRMLRPVHPLLHYAAENLSALPVRALFALPVALIALFVIAPGELTHDPLRIALFFVALAGAWVLSFLAMAVIGALCFFIDNSTAIFQLWFGLFMLLSGYLVPAVLFPPWLSTLAQVLPFRFMLAFPVETLVGGAARAELLWLLAAQLGYIGGFALLLALTWRAGMRRFNAFGG